MGRVVGSLCVVSAKEGDAESAMLASWVSQASFVPPGLTIAVCTSLHQHCRHCHTHLTIFTFYIHIWALLLGRFSAALHSHSSIVRSRWAFATDTFHQCLPLTGEQELPTFSYFSQRRECCQIAYMILSAKVPFPNIVRIIQQCISETFPLHRYF